MDSLQEKTALGTDNKPKMNKNGDPKKIWVSCPPEIGKNQKTNNAILKTWHPELTQLDDLISLEKEKHERNSGRAPLYVAYQKSVRIDGSEVLARTFEDALILENLENEYIKNKANLEDREEQDLARHLYDFVRNLNKGDFAFDCLFYLSRSESHTLTPPEYIKDGLSWLNEKLTPKSQ